MKHKKLFCAALSLVLTLSLGACGVKSPNAPGSLKPIGQTTTSTAQDGTTAPGGTTAAPTEAMDLANMDLTPYITLGNYKGIDVSMEEVSISDETLDSELKSYIDSCQYYTPITDRATVKGDVVLIDYVGTLDGVAFSGGTATGQTLELSENSGYIDGFADGLIGKMPGETVELHLTFPENYHATELAGKAVVFTVVIQSIRGDLVTPTLSDEFITLLTGSDYTTVDAFRAYYRSYLESQAAAEAKETAMATLWSTVVQNCTVHEVPEQQVQYYYEQLVQSYTSYAASYGMTYASLASVLGITDEKLTEQAREYAKDDLVFFAIVRAEGISLSDDEYTTGVADIAAANGVDSTTVENYYGKQYIYNALLNDKCMDMLWNNASVHP